MKRTNNIPLDSMQKSSPLLMLTPMVLAVVTASVYFFGVGKSEPAYVATSVDDCNNNTDLTMQQCEAAYKQAVEQAANIAPRYKSKRDCEYEFGNSQCRTSGNNFIPLMTGFLVASAISNNRYNPVYSYYGSNSSSRNGYVYADGTYLGTRSNKSIKLPSKTITKKTKSSTKTMSRGGFGSTASAKSSWGSKSRSSSSWGG